MSSDADKHQERLLEEAGGNRNRAALSEDSVSFSKHSGHSSHTAQQLNSSVFTQRGWKPASAQTPHLSYWTARSSGPNSHHLEFSHACSQQIITAKLVGVGGP